MRLLAVPGASIWRTQRRHQIGQFLKALGQPRGSSRGSKALLYLVPTVLQRVAPAGALWYAPNPIGAPVQFTALTEAVVPGEQEEGFIIRDRRGSSVGSDRPAPTSSHSQAAPQEAPS